MKSFSFIVPIYNVEEYLRRCIESLLCQKYDQRKIEIILVDDGSPDKCGEICDEYAKGNSNIRVFHKQNGGLSDARNFGLEHAINNYVIFVDADDYVSPKTCMEFDRVLEKHGLDCDIVTGGVMWHKGESQTVWNTHDIPEGVLSGCEFLKNRLKIGKWYVAAWSSTYRREFLVENNLKFKKGILHEDEEFSPRAFLSAKSVCCTDFIFYNYIIRENSITTSKNKTKNAIDIFNTCRDLDIIYNNICDQELKKLLMTHSAKICFGVIEEARLYLKDNRALIDKEIIRKNCIYLKEKIRWYIFLISPRLLHMLKM